MIFLAYYDLNNKTVFYYSLYHQESISFDLTDDEFEEILSELYG